MDILENIVYPQSQSHVELLKYMLFVTLLLLLPYISVMLGSTLFSIMHFNKGRKTKNPIYLTFSNELIDLFTKNKGMAFALGIVPMISAMFIFGQLLLNAEFNATPHLFFALLIFIVALIYIYTYKYSFKLKNIFNLVKIGETTDSAAIEEFEDFKQSNSKLLSKSGLIGFLLLLLVTYILISVLQFSIDSSRWTADVSLIDIFLSPNSIIYFLFYLSFSFSITCAALVYKYFKVEHVEKQLSYTEYVKDFSLKTGLIFTLIQPLLYVITVISSPESAVSFSLFITVALVLSVMLVISILFYLMYKESKTSLSGTTVLVSLILASLLIYKNQLAFETTNQLQFDEVTKEYEVFAAELKEKAGIFDEVEISGEDIYNAKCIACHKFDALLVGPAYNDVLPKYEGKQEDLVKFILNPYKVNPELPIMPNQGLKPKEAEAIAEYIVKIYKGQ